MSCYMSKNNADSNVYIKQPPLLLKLRRRGNGFYVA